VTLHVQPSRPAADTPADGELRPNGRSAPQVKNTPRIGIVTMGNSRSDRSVGPGEHPDETTATVEEDA
jgi:hypothetical protein